MMSAWAKIFALLLLSAMLSACVSIIPEGDSSGKGGVSTAEEMNNDITSAIYSQGLPRVYITADAPIKRDTYTKGKVRITNSEPLFGTEGDFESDMEIRGRGNSSWNMFDKKPYKLKLSEQARLFNLAKDRQWCLIPNYSDKTLLRNTLAMEVSSIVEFDWTPGVVHTEVYLNEEYCGVYDLIENRKVGKERVEIDLVDPESRELPDIEGDYYLELAEENISSPYGWWTSIYKLPVVFKDPEQPNEEQRNYVKNYFAEMEKTLSEEDFSKQGRRRYASYIDVDSFIRYFIVEEVAKDWDGDMRRSVFLTKEKGKGIKIYHVWDFDIAFGNCFDKDLGDPLSPEGWYIKTYCHKTGGEGTGIMKRLFDDPVFCQRAREMWDEAYPQLKKLPEFLDRHASVLGKSIERNFWKWDIMGKKVWPNAVVYDTYEEELAYLKDYVSKRVEWINENL